MYPELKEGHVVFDGNGSIRFDLRSSNIYYSSNSEEAVIPFELTSHKSSHDIQIGVLLFGTNAVLKEFGNVVEPEFGGSISPIFFHIRRILEGEGFRVSLGLKGRFIWSPDE